MKTLISLAISLLLLACDSTSNTNEGTDNIDCTSLSEGSVIEFTSPAKDETYKVGDTIVLQWKMNPENLTGVLAQVSNDGGSTWSEPLHDESLFTDAKETKCYEYSWVIEEELVLVDGAENTMVKFRVRDYADVLLRGVSEQVTVTP